MSDDPTVVPHDDVAEVPWLRVDSRMLVVGPIKTLVDNIPLLIGIVIFGAAAGVQWWQGLIVLGLGAYGLLTWFTTSYRITRGRLEVRSGVLVRQRRSTPIVRIRSVDLTSPLVHRLFGLTNMKIGTGTTTIGDDEMSLDGLSAARAAGLRSDLLSSARARRDGPDPTTPPSHDVTRPDVGPEDVGPEESAEVVAQLDPSWARFAPLTTMGLVGSAAVIGVGFQVLEQGGLLDRLPDHTALRLGVWLLAALIALMILVVIIVAPVITYLVTQWDFTLTRETDSWSVRRGLFTTRHTSLDRSRLAGLDIAEPLPLRLAGAAKLDAIATGTSVLGDESTSLLPVAPRGVIDRVGIDVLGLPAPVVAPLTSHGPAAVRRRWIRALGGAAVVSGALLVLVVTDVPPDWADVWGVLLAVAVVMGAVVLAADRARSLGHVLIDDHLVFRSGSMTRSREILKADQIIGWRMTSTVFQRRLGLLTLTATTAGGSQSITAADMPKATAVAVTNAAVPGLVSQFLE